LFTDEFYYT